MRLIVVGEFIQAPKAVVFEEVLGADWGQIGCTLAGSIAMTLNVSRMDFDEMQVVVNINGTVRGRDAAA